MDTDILYDLSLKAIQKAPEIYNATEFEGYSGKLFEVWLTYIKRYKVNGGKSGGIGKDYDKYKHIYFNFKSEHYKYLVDKAFKHKPHIYTEDDFRRSDKFSWPLAIHIKDLEKAWRLNLRKYRLDKSLKF